MSKDIETKVNAIEQQYFGGDMKTFDDSVFKSLSNAFTDSGFHIGTDIMVRYVIELKYFFLRHFYKCMLPFLCSF